MNLRAESLVYEPFFLFSHPSTIASFQYYSSILPLSLCAENIYYLKPRYQLTISGP